MTNVIVLNPSNIPCNLNNKKNIKHNAYEYTYYRCSSIKYKCNHRERQ